MTDSRKQYLLPMIIIGGLFFIFGFVTWLNSILIPFLQQACRLTNFQAYLVTFSFYISYFFMAIPSSAVLNRIGYAKGMSIGLVTMALGALIFIPAAMTRAYPLFLLGLFTQATGMTLLQTAANPYVTILGPVESAAKRISIMGLSNKVAGMTGIMILGQLLFKDAKILSFKIQTLTGTELEAELDLLASRVITPYVVMAVVLILFSIAILKTHLPEISPKTDANDESVNASNEKKTIFAFPHLVLGVFCIFVYVGVEIIAIDTLGLYGQYQGFDLSVSSKFGIYSLIGLSIGYLLGVILIPKIINQRTALAWSATMGFAFGISALLTSGWISIVFIILLSFAHSFMWPAIWPLALNGLGKFTKIGSALLIMGIVGGAILPLVYGAIADYSNRQIAYTLILPCYLYIFFFATIGYRNARTKRGIVKQ